MSPLWQLILTRFREFYREPAALFWVYGFPLILAFALGMAFRERPVAESAIIIQLDAKLPKAAEKLRDQLSLDPSLKVELLGEAEARARLRSSKADLIVVPQTGTPPGYEYLYDQTRAESVLARNAVDRALLQAANPGIPRAPERALSEPGGRYIDFLIPGLLGINLLGGGLFGVGFAVTDLRVRKLLKRFQATPMRRSDFMLSLMVSRLVFTLIDVTLLLGFSYLIFETRVRGNFVVFGCLVLLGAVCFAGIGLLIGSRAKTLETAAGLVNAVMLPMYVLSGVFFSAARFPDTVQPLIQILPLTALIDSLRAVMNEGASWEVLPYPLLVLGTWGILSYVVALRIFRWR